MEDIVLTSSSGAELTLTSQPDVSIQLGDIGGPIGPQGPTGQQGPAGPQGVPGPSGPSGTIHSVVAGTNITVDNTDPANPKISTTGTTSPLTAKGDVYTFSTTNDRLPVGTDGQILTADSTKTTGLKWAAAPVSGVTSVSVASANGIAGTVTNPTTTPAITLNTTVTGLLKGNGTAISAATATDIPNIAESQVTNLTTDLAAKAPLASPTFTGTPAAPTPATTDNSTTLATTAFVKTLAGTSSIVDNETPAGTVNGTNKVFTLASTPATNSLNVYKNGIRLKPTSDYTLSGSTITFVTAPASGAVLLADYNISNSAYSVGTNSIITDEVPTGTVNGTNTSFTAARAYIAGSLQVFINGVKQSRTTHFTETTPSSGTFTMSDAPLTGDNIVINYQFNLNPSSNADTVDGIHASATATANQLMPLDGNAKIGANYLYNPYKFSVYLNAAYNTVATTFTDVPYDTKVFDTGNNYNTTTHVFTAPVAGFYQFNAAFTVQTPVTRIFVTFIKNGSEFYRGSDLQGTAAGIGNAVFMQLAANDTVKMQYYVAAVVAAATGPNTAFNGFLVSTT